MPETIANPIPIASPGSTPGNVITLAELDAMIKAATLKKEDLVSMVKEILADNTIVNRVITPIPSDHKAKWNMGDIALAAKRKYYGRPSANDAIMKKDLTINDDAQAGFLLPKEYEAEIMKYALDFAIVRPRARKRPISSGDTLALKAFKDIVQSTTLGVHGGVICRWGQEATQLTESNIKAELINFKVEKLYGYLEDTNEFESDVPGANGWIGAALMEACAWFEDLAFLRGSGVGQPLGAHIGPVKYTVNRNLAAHFNATDVGAMLAKFVTRMNPASTCWCMNVNVMPDVLALEDSAGRRLWQPDIKLGLSSPLMGFPICWTSLVPTLGTQGDVSLNDFSYYWIVDREGIRMDYDKSYLFGYDMTAYRCITRTDGRPWLSSYITAPNSVYYSPFVVLN